VTKECIEPTVEDVCAGDTTVMVRGTVTNCAPLENGDTLENIIVTDNVGFITTTPPSSLAPGDSFDYEGFYIGEENITVTDTVTASAVGQVSQLPISNTASAECTPPECPESPLGCRITGGGIASDARGDIALGEIKKATFGGQVGASCGCIGCFDIEDDMIQGNWTHSRKVKKGRFHAKDYSSLVCDLDNGEGPEPRPAPANKACFAGIGYLAEGGGKRSQPVAFRVEVEDRGEPGAGSNSGDMADVYRMRIWIPGQGENPEDLLDGICCLNAEPVGVPDPDVDDGGELIKGNIQIHPVLPNTERDICPPPTQVTEECFADPVVEPVVDP
jgi:hypothetical protein